MESPRELNDDDLGHVSGGAGNSAGAGNGAGPSANDMEQMFLQAMIDSGLVPASAAGKPLADAPKLMSPNSNVTAADLMTSMLALQAATQQSGLQSAKANQQAMASIFSEQTAKIAEMATKMQDAANKNMSSSVALAQAQIVSSIMSAMGAVTPAGGKTGALDGAMKALSDGPQGKVIAGPSMANTNGSAVGSMMQGQLDAKANDMRASGDPADAATSAGNAAAQQQAMQELMQNITNFITELKEAQASQMAAFTRAS